MKPPWEIGPVPVLHMTWILKIWTNTPVKTKENRHLCLQLWKYARVRVQMQRHEAIPVYLWKGVYIVILYLWFFARTCKAICPQTILRGFLRIPFSILLLWMGPDVKALLSLTFLISTMSQDCYHNAMVTLLCTAQQRMICWSCCYKTWTAGCDANPNDFEDGGRGQRDKAGKGERDRNRVCRVSVQSSVN